MKPANCSGVAAIACHYRPTENVVKRPTHKGGRGYSIVGHHELLVPLWAAAVIEQLK